MNKLLKSYQLVAVLLFALSCTTQIAQQRESIQKTLSTYLSAKIQDIDSTIKIDSLQIIYIDSVSSKEDFKMKILTLLDSLNRFIDISESKAKMLQLDISKYKLMKSLNSISSESSDLSPFKESIEEQKKESENALVTMKILQDEIDSLKTIYNLNNVDSTDFLYYGVIL